MYNATPHASVPVRIPSTVAFKLILNLIKIFVTYTDIHVTNIVLLAWLSTRLSSCNTYYRLSGRGMSALCVPNSYSQQCAEYIVDILSGIIQYKRMADGQVKYNISCMLTMNMDNIFLYIPNNIVHRTLDNTLHR